MKRGEEAQESQIPEPLLVTSGRTGPNALKSTLSLWIDCPVRGLFHGYEEPRSRSSFFDRFDHAGECPLPTLWQ